MPSSLSAARVRPTITTGKKYQPSSSQEQQEHLAPPPSLQPLRALPTPTERAAAARRPETASFFPRRTAWLACLLSLLAVIFSGCTPYDLALTGGAAIGEAMMEERGLTTSARDKLLRLQVNDAIFKHSLRLYQGVSLMVNRGEVILVGRVPNELSKFEAALLAREAGAKAVHNALTVGPELSWGTVLKDRLINNQLALDLIADSDVASVNFQHIVKDKVVYIAGDARRKSELRRVAYLASHLPDVERVITYIYVLPPRIEDIEDEEELAPDTLPSLES